MIPPVLVDVPVVVVVVVVVIVVGDGGGGIVGCSEKFAFDAAGCT
jgi:hypothetical protein